MILITTTPESPGMEIIPSVDPINPVRVIRPAIRVRPAGKPSLESMRKAVNAILGSPYNLVKKAETHIPYTVTDIVRKQTTWMNFEYAGRRTTYKVPTLSEFRTKNSSSKRARKNLKRWSRVSKAMRAVGSPDRGAWEKRVEEEMEAYEFYCHQTYWEYPLVDDNFPTYMER